MKVTKDDNLGSLHTSFSQLKIDVEERGNRNIISNGIIPAKAKNKTRRAAQLSKTDITSDQLEEQKLDKQSLFAIDKRAFKVFSTLFHNPSQSDISGEVSWNAFLHAMTATEFMLEKLYESV